MALPSGHMASRWAAWVGTHLTRFGKNGTLEVPFGWGVVAATATTLPALPRTDPGVTRPPGRVTLPARTRPATSPGAQLARPSATRVWPRPRRAQSAQRRGSRPGTTPLPGPDVTQVAEKLATSAACRSGRLPRSTGR